MKDAMTDVCGRVMAIVLLAAGCAAAGEVRYLANDGDDAADGRTPATAWRTVAKMNEALPGGGTALLRRGDVFYGGFKLKNGGDMAHRTTVTAYGTGPRPVISAFKIVKPSAWKAVNSGYRIWKAHIADPTQCDGIVSKDNNPGCLVVDGEVWPWRQYSRHDVNLQWDFAEEDGWLYVHSTNNPALIAKDIRVSVRVPGIILANHVAVSNVAVRGTGAHGMHGGWGGALEDVLIADCDFENIGGSELVGYGNKEIRVRYGNGIEFGDGCNGATIERCTFRGVYDVAFTMQGRPAKSGGWRDVACRNCTMTECTQAFEIWCQNAPKGIGYERCSFTGNRMCRVGTGWGARSRPNRQSCTPLLVYRLDTDQVDIDISGNVIEESPKGILYASGGIDALPPGYRVHDNVVKPFAGPVADPVERRR